MKAKTRQKIIAAALQELSRNPHASLEQIAVSATVSRITLFRYFPQRHELMFALHQEALRIFGEIMKGVLHEDSPANHKLLAFVQKMVPYGATFHFLFYEPSRSADPRMARLLQDYYQGLHALIHALSAEGHLVVHSSPRWAARHLDAVLCMAWDAIEQGELAPKAAPELVIRTFYQGTGALGTGTLGTGALGALPKIP